MEWFIRLKRSCAYKFGQEKTAFMSEFSVLQGLSNIKIRSFSIFEDATATWLVQIVQIVFLTVNAPVNLVMVDQRAVDVHINFIAYQQKKNAQVFDMLIIIFAFILLFVELYFSNLEGGAPTFMTDVIRILEQGVIGTKCTCNMYHMHK